MNGFFWRIQRFMAGRNGMDKFNRFLFVLYLLMCIVNIFVRSLIVYLVQWLFVVYIIFRVLSRNIIMRSKENRIYCNVRNSVVNFIIRHKNKFRDRKTHRYIKCRHCKATLRVKRNKGNHTVRCPKCRQEFSVKIR